MQMGLTGKLEADVMVKADAVVFHHVFSRRPYQTAKASPGKILSCELIEGDWGNTGFVVNWSYVHEGKARNDKAQVIVIDDVNNASTYRVFEGGIMKDFKSFAITVKATPAAAGSGMGSVVHWTFDYEKRNGDVPDPLSFLQFMIHLTKDTDSHLRINKSA